VGSDGTYYGRGWYFRDITERKRQERRLRRALEELQEHEQFRVQLLNNVCHELANPMTPILLQLGLLEQMTPKESREGRAVQLLRRNAEQLRRLVEDLKDVTRLGSGKLTLRAEDAELNDLAQHAVDSLREQAEGWRVELRFRPGAALPLKVDPGRISQVLLNLLTNALKFTPPGGRVTVDTARWGGEACLQVRDTGRGLSDEELGRLFKPFSQAHAPGEARAKGTGLGLFVSKGIVEQHGGRIWAESRGLGCGATFALALPIAQPGGAATGAADPASA
jgi:signal transduction histidine kinase